MGAKGPIALSLLRVSFQRAEFFFFFRKQSTNGLAFRFVRLALQQLAKVLNVEARYRLRHGRPPLASLPYNTPRLNPTGKRRTVPWDQWWHIGDPLNTGLE